MDTNQLLQEVRAKANGWLGEAYDAETQAKVREMLDSEDTTELIESFYKDLEFGTGGLRGIMGAGSNRMNRYTVGAATQGLANYLKKEFASSDRISVAIGYDCRHNSRQFAQTVAEIFTANGIYVYLFEALRPTPEVSYVIRRLGCQSGVMVTASHNPPEYNGYKVYWSDGAQVIAPHDQSIIAEVGKISSVDKIRFQGDSSMITLLGEEMDNDFIAKVKSLSLSPESVQRHKDLAIVYTPIHGTGGTIVPKALRAFGFENILNVPEQDVISGDFPTVVSPNPEEPAALKMAIERANETKANMVLASDPDGDRIGVAVRNKEGEMVLMNGNEICALLTYYSIARRKEKGELAPNDYVVKTIVTTELIKAIADDYQVQLFDCYTGFKWIADVVRKNEVLGKRYIGGGEESYGFLWEDFIRDKSSVSACCIFAEMAAWALDKGLTIYELMRSLYVKYGFYKEVGVSIVRKGRTGAQEIAEMMRKYREQPMTQIAGSPIVEILDYQSLEKRDLRSGKTEKFEMPATSNVLQYKSEDGSKLSIRPSGTEPKIKYYIGLRRPVANELELDTAYKTAEEAVAKVRKDLGNI
ncbi:Phosphoglucomutase [Porphyromonas crevioricanis]|uniref:Phosphoglucomutase n=1 Tax=Porphyromonas crevioricanis TaxID=393921 RepID=A0A2X4PP69_9PORP|nr:phospho-sugar mutase [Porphyromonas crevioricanis]GAD06679.1 phosphoglucomutase [Porphyromonas crevioricanis JCM 13913]SQH73348.1 Phosphoglucomutase [Porphyromonas crevioricanis]